MKLYERLAGELQDRIEKGLYVSGQRLPSIRSLSQEHQVSISTVQEAYRVLEDQGLAEPRPKSGYFVRPRPTRLALPETSRPAQRPLEVSQWTEVLNLLCSSENLGALSLGRGVPDLDAPTLRPLLKFMSGGGSAAERRRLDYDALAGTIELRRQIARLAVDSGCALHPDEIVVTTGCQEALSSAIRAITRPGDVVAVDSPSFYGSMQAIAANGLKAMEIPTHPETGISLEALELALEQWPITALQLTPTCNNPLGYSMPDESRRRLIALAQRFDLAIIEDDIYGDLCYTYPRPRTIKSFDHDGRVVLCSSVSKTLAPGLRVGWVVPGRYHARLVHAKYVSSGASAIAPQLAVAEFIAAGAYERHVRRMRVQYRVRRDAMLDSLGRHFPECARISYPGGGFLLWVELPAGFDSIVLDQRLATQGIRIAPGSLFSASGKYRNCIRLNFAGEPCERVEAALRVVGQEIARMLDQGESSVA